MLGLINVTLISCYQQQLHLPQLDVRPSYHNGKWLTGIELKRLKCHINSTYSGRFTQSLQKSCRRGQSPNYKCQPIAVFTQHILNFLFYSDPIQYYHINKQRQCLKGMWSFSGYSFMMQVRGVDIYIFFYRILCDNLLFRKSTAYR